MFYKKKVNHLGQPNILLGSQRVGHNWATELNWTEYITASILRFAEGQQFELDS